MSDQFKKNDVGVALGMHGEEERCIPGSGWKSERNRPLSRPRRRCEDDVEIALEEDGWECRMDRSGLGGTVRGLL